METAIPMNEQTLATSPVAQRFRGYLPVVIDVETAGFEPRTDAFQDCPRSYEAEGL